MGFQQELFEVDLERGDTLKGGSGNGNTQHRAEQAITLSLVLLMAANVVVRPDSHWGKLLAWASFVLGVGGSIAMARNTPRTPHTRKILLILLTCWLVYGIRLVLLGAQGHGAHKHRIHFGIPARHHPHMFANPHAQHAAHPHTHTTHGVHGVPHTVRMIQAPGPVPASAASASVGSEMDSRVVEVEEPVRTVDDQHVAVIGDSSSDV